MPQASPDLAIALSREYRFGEELANFHHQILIGVHLRATLLWLPQPLVPLASGIEAGSRQRPDRGHSRHTIRLITGRRKCAAHAFDFHDTKVHSHIVWRRKGNSNSESSRGWERDGESALGD